MLVAQSYPTLCDSMDYCLPGSSVYGIFPGKSTGICCHFLLKGSSWPRDWTLHVSLLRKRKWLAQCHRHVKGSRDSAWFLALAQGSLCRPVGSCPPGLSWEKRSWEKGSRLFSLWSGFDSFLSCLKGIQLSSLPEKALWTQAVNYPFIYSSNH